MAAPKERFISIVAGDCACCAAASRHASHAGRALPQTPAPILIRLPSTPHRPGDCPLEAPVLQVAHCQNPGGVVVNGRRIEKLDEHEPQTAYRVFGSFPAL